MRPAPQHLMIPPIIQDIALTWVASRWLDDHDTRAAICTLARLGETNLDLNLGHFIGLDDEWSGGWGRLRPVLKAEADKTLADILNRPMIRHNPDGAKIRDDRWGQRLDETHGACRPSTGLCAGERRPVSDAAATPWRREGASPLG